ncbi:hypothetical protein EXD82_05010 [Peptacetobacter hominis]|uniref:Cyclophilin-like domain-containing protein n=1 Tax=Peptacetobacter hominis TaxID=2743610 RepID=A0A544QVQ3_9FIRM|nr:cyclophilin-like fold protein [Peptacetobacter hominis]TQQ84764.1 hypothetical protein EXD82_05010 [Peptacetobacter hominis]
MKSIIISSILILFMILFSGCKNLEDNSDIEKTNSKIISDGGKEMDYIDNLHMLIDGKKVDILWENNKTVKEIAMYAKSKRIKIKTSKYDNFEQVGKLPKTFNSDDKHMKASPGDIVLYSGNQLVLFFGNNSWSYTKLGKISGFSNKELTDLLDDDEKIIEIYFE